MKTDANGYYNQKDLDKLAPTIMIAKQIDGQQFDILEYHKNYSSNKKTADEMFKELGYEKIVDDENRIIYDNNVDLNEDIYNTRIIFKIDLKEIKFSVNEISLDELQAINKKVEELQWK